MFFISFVLAFFIFLIAISIINLFLSFAIKLVTNNTIDEYKFIIPSVLYLIINGITFILIYTVTTNVLDLSIKDSLMAIIFKTIDISDKIRTVLALDLILLIISIILQSVCLMTVNIDYTVTFGKVRMMFKDLFKKMFKKKENIKKDNISTEKVDDEVKEKNESEKQLNSEVDKEKTNDDISNLAFVIPEGEMSENKKRLKLNFGNAIICTIFIFSFLFFTFMGLFTVGSIISSKIL